jgi:hypothetical protein
MTYDDPNHYNHYNHNDDYFFLFSVRTFLNGVSFDPKNLPDEVSLFTYLPVLGLYNWVLSLMTPTRWPAPVFFAMLYYNNYNNYNNDSIIYFIYFTYLTYGIII